MKVFMLTIILTMPNGDQVKWPGVMGASDKQSCVALVRYISSGLGIMGMSGKLQYKCEPAKLVPKPKHIT